MDKETQEFLDEIYTVCKKHKIKCASICGTRTNENFIGYVGGPNENKNIYELTEAIVNVGRMWQHARAVLRDTLNGFEK